MEPTGVGGELVAGIATGAAVVGAALARILPSLVGARGDRRPDASTTQPMRAPEPTMSQVYAAVEDLRRTTEKVQDDAQAVRAKVDSIEAVVRAVGEQTRELATTNAKLSTLVELMRERRTA